MDSENNAPNHSAPKGDRQPNANQGNRENNNSNRPKYNKRGINGRPGYQKGYGNRQEKNHNKDLDKSNKDNTNVDFGAEGAAKRIKNENYEPKNINNSQENTFEQKGNNQPKQKNEGFKNNRKEKKNFVKPEETAEDIRKDTKRIEKEIELEIKEIGALKLGL